MIGLYELLGNPTTLLIEPPGPLKRYENENHRIQYIVSHLQYFIYIINAIISFITKRGIICKLIQDVKLKRAQGETNNNILVSFGPEHQAFF